MKEESPLQNNLDIMIPCHACGYPWQTQIDVIKLLRNMLAYFILIFHRNWITSVQVCKKYIFKETRKNDHFSSRSHFLCNPGNPMTMNEGTK